jgi:hypothetical protein
MISGAHALIYSTDADATRVCAPTDDQPQHRLHLMCDDLDATMTELSVKGVEFVHRPQDTGWGVATAIQCRP